MEGGLWVKDLILLNISLLFLWCLSRYLVPQKGIFKVLLQCPNMIRVCGSGISLGGGNLCEKSLSSVSIFCRRSMVLVKRYICS